jgi:TIR domain
MDGDTSTTETAPRQPAPADGGKLRVFISYSRDDLDFADQLDTTLRLLGFETSLDRHAISGGEEWRKRLGNLIREADTVVFVLSPSSAASGICAWEVEEAIRCQKRIIPVVCRALESVSAPAQLEDLNYIFFYLEPKAPGSGFGTGAAKLAEALRNDLAWLREHTRLYLRAGEWEAGGKPESRLLSGSDIAAAKAWAAQRPKGAPEPTALHLAFIRASEEIEDARLVAQRRQLEEIAAAQEERAKALQAAEEALSRTLRLQRRQAIAGTVIAVVLAMIGWWVYGVLGDRRAVAGEAAREDIRGQIVAYAAAFGSTEMDVAEGQLTSPYTTPLAQKLRQKKNLVEAITDAHKQVLDSSKGVQRPLLSTSLNGQIYLHQQPPTRRKRVLAVAVDDPGRGVSRLAGPPHDVAAIVAALMETGFSESDITTLTNPDRQQIEDAIAAAAQALRQKAPGASYGRLWPMTPLVHLARIAVEPPPAPPPNNTLLVFFFSGHGVQVAGRNYIIPKLPGAAPLNGPEDIESSALDIGRLTQALERAAAASVVILDTHFPAISPGVTR